MTNPNTPPLLPSQAAARLYGGDLALLNEGLKRGLRVDAKWPMWDIPLLHGICLFSPPHSAEMARAILEAGADINHQHDGLSPILFALGGYNREEGDPHGSRLNMIELLAKVDPHPQLGTWAMCAIRLGYVQALEMFLDLGCDPNYTVEKGHSLLHEAYKQKNEKIGSALISRGANSNALNEAGQDPASASAPLKMADNEQEQSESEALDLAIKTLRAVDMPEGRNLRL